MTHETCIHIADAAMSDGLAAINDAIAGRFSFGIASDHFARCEAIYSAIAKAPTEPKQAARFAKRATDAANMARRAAILQEVQLMSVSLDLRYPSRLMSGTFA
jgi:hypothetical protein